VSQRHALDGCTVGAASPLKLMHFVPQFFRFDEGRSSGEARQDLLQPTQQASRSLRGWLLIDRVER